MTIAATAEFNSSFHPTKAEARKRRIEDLTTVSGVLVAMPELS
jgi:hypothetical protein